MQEPFLNLVIAGEDSDIDALIGSLMRDGVSAQAILVHLFTYAARQLGVLWEQDLCDFSDVTIGLCRLHRILRENAHLRVHANGDGLERHPRTAKRAIFSTLEGEQHIFGVAVVAELFRLDGWIVDCVLGLGKDSLAARLRSAHYDILGLSISNLNAIDTTKDEVDHYRRSSVNADIKVLAGGSLFNSNPASEDGLAASVGVDGTAIDGESAVALANSLVARAARHC